MRHGVYKNRFFGSGRARKQSWISVWIAMVWAGMGFSSGVHAADVVWNFGSTAPGTTSPTSGTPPANLTIAGITQGTIAITSGSGTSPTYTGNSAGCNIGFAAKAGVLDITAGTGSAYFEFILTPASGYSFLLSAVSFGSRSTSTGPKNLTLRSSVDNYASEIGITAAALSDSSWGMKDFGFLSLASSALTTFRIYGYNGTGSGSGNWRVDDVKISVSVINGPVVYANGSLNPFSNTSGTASGEQTFSVSGYNLTGDLTVTPPEGFEIKTAGDYTSLPVAILRSGVSVAPTTVTVRVAAATPANSSLSGNLMVSSSGASDKTLAVSGTVSPDTAPFISVSTNALPAFSASSGSVSASQSFTTAAKNLTNEFTVTAPGGFQVSTNGVDFTQSLTLAQTNGLSTNTVSVRVAGTNSASSLSGNVVMASAGASSVNVAATATVTIPTITVSMNPERIYENATSTGTVTLPARIADLTIDLISETTGAVTAASSVTLPAGQTSVNFTATGVTDSGYAEKVTVITARAPNCISGTAALAVLNADSAPTTPISLDGSNSNSYSQNFDGLGTNSVPRVFPASNGVQVSLGAITANTVNGWYGAKIAGTGTSATDLLANAGTTSTGTLYSFGITNDVNRALGTIATGTTTMAFGALIKNDTGGTITNMKVSFTAEFWRNAIPTSSSSSAETNVLVFGYGKIDGASNSVSNFLISSNALSQTSLNITGPAPVAYGTTPVNLDGSLPANQVQFSNVAVPLSLAAGEMAFVRWQDKDNTGLDAGIGMDNFILSYEVDRSVTLISFSPAVGPEGTQVTIRGANFTDGIPVKFNGTAASLVSLVSSTELAVTVPAGATTGYITVGEEPTAVTSATAFVVGDLSFFITGGNFNFGSTSLEKVCFPQGGLLTGLSLDLLIDSPDFVVSGDYGATYGTSASIPVVNGVVDSNYFFNMRFTPGASAGAKTGTATLSSGGLVLARYSLSGTAAGIRQPYGFGYGQDGQAYLGWISDSSYTDLVMIGQVDSSVTTPISGSVSYSGNPSLGSGTMVGTASTVFAGDGGTTSVTVTGLTNQRFYYFKLYNRENGAVSTGKEIRVMPYADITSGVITRWKFNNNDLSPNTGFGTASAVGGVTAGFVNGLGGSSDRAAANKAASIKGASGVFTGMQFAVSTVGKKEVKVFWDIAASGSASKYTKFQYTLDVTATPPVWVDYSPALQDSPGVTPAGGLYVVDTADSTLLQRSADLSLVSGVENNAKFGFRVISSNAPGTSSIARADGTSAAYSTAGTVKYDMVTVTGVDGVFGTPLSNYLDGFDLIGDNALGTADPDGDGINNSAEFAFGTSPVSGASRAITQTIVAGGIKITWLQRSGVTYAVKSSTDLTVWLTGTVIPSKSDPQPSGLSSGYEQWEATLTGGDKGFLKVEAIVP